ncbi:MAG TPA: DUF2779 domain-containing protein, partial [Bacteroidia bacterium]|nr:DUF2779 domain-containing protein [Bacteroidia bacterium]
MAPAIPRFRGTSCFQKVCVQFSMLTNPEGGSEFIQNEFLANHTVDPRKEIIEKFLEYTHGDGKIVVYSENVVKKRLRELAELYQAKYASEIRNRIS